MLRDALPIAWIHSLEAMRWILKASQMNHIFPTADAHWASVCKKRKATDNAHDMVAGLEDLGRLNAHASRADRHVIVRDT